MHTVGCTKRKRQLMLGGIGAKTDGALYLESEQKREYSKIERRS